MRLQEGCVPELAWKVSKGAGSKEWTILADEGAYRRMMEAAAKRIRTEAKRTGQEPGLGSGWRIELKTLNEVKRVDEESDENDAVPVKEREKKKKKKSAGKEKKKRKRGGKKKVFLSQLPMIPLL